MWTVVKLTYREMFHRRVFLVAVVLTALFLLLYGTGLYFANKHPMRDPMISKVAFSQMLSIGLYLSSFIIAFLAVLGSVGTIAGEVESGVIQTILVKPLERWEIVLGKYFGLALIMLVYSTVFFFTVLGLNVLFAKGSHTLYWLSVGKAWTLFVTLPLLVLSISLWGSTFLTTLNNGVMVVMLYSFATIGGFMEQIGSVVRNEGLINVGIFSSLIMPVDAIYRKMVNTLLTGGPGDFNLAMPTMFTGKVEPSGWMLVYTYVFILFFIWRAVRVFAQRDI
ncbi:MAG: hypothetical protein JG781_1649 [Peptococcaceae bacterium]|jgi:ABC-type transport system involved in multi-copper enzyme maturation permease subunit|nr:hypothetical protein [Peptococcaceae bacterium]